MSRGHAPNVGRTGGQCRAVEGPRAARPAGGPGAALRAGLAATTARRSIYASYGHIVRGKHAAMEIPRVSRPYMPGYGISGPAEGSGLLEWSWAAERLTAARNYWVATVWPTGRPHLMPVWGMWDDSTLWFSSAAGSRKTKNLRADPHCVISTESASDPVIIEGTARVVTEPAALQRVIDLMNAKYRTHIEVGFLDPSVNATFGVRPLRVFGMRDADFTGSPTRWIFED